MTTPAAELLFIGIKGRVLALERASGAEVWRTKLQYGAFTNLAVVGDQLFAAVNGELYCLSPQDGSVQWHNPLKGMGTGFLSMAAAGMQAQSMAALADEEQRQAAAAAVVVTTSASSH
ncbi:MAG: PQQ-binding-like beta-propeller repeat protein [Planctomycetota bacterium]